MIVCSWSAARLFLDTADLIVPNSSRRYDTFAWHGIESSDAKFCRVLLIAATSPSSANLISYVLEGCLVKRL